MPLFRSLRSLVLLATLVLAGCAGTPAGRQATTRLPEALTASALRAGDNLIVSLQGVPDPSNNSVQVDDRGLISLPYIGTLPAAGNSVATLASQIRAAYLEKKIYLNVDVSVVATERYVFVGGEVNRPGRILWTPDLTVTKAIQAAGGFTVYAKETALSVVRDRVAYPFDSVDAQKHPESDAHLAPGDAIQVPKTAF